MLENASILKIGDKVLIGIIVIFLIATFFFSLSNNDEGRNVSIIVDGQMQYHETIQSQKNLKVDGPLGKTVVQFREGHVAVLSSPCPHKMCIKMGKIRNAGEIIVCVPNRILIRIDGKLRDVDGVTM